VRCRRFGRHAAALPVTIVGSRAALVAALALPFALLGLVLAFGVNLPYYDEWWWADLLYRERTGALTFADLWAPHNEHRILVARLLMLGLAHLGGWSVVRELCFSVGLVAATQLVLWRLVRRSIDAATIPLAFLVSSLALYDLAQTENFESGFQMSWLVCTFALVFCVGALTRRDAPAGALVAAIVVAVLASFSLAQGLFIWPAGVVAVLLTRVRVVERLLPWVACGVIAVVLQHLGIAAHGGGIPPWHHPLDILEYVVVFLGAPLAYYGGVVASAAAGAAVLAVMVLLVLRDVRLGDGAPARHAPWYALACYAVLVAVATAFGRADLGVAQALSPRYSTNAIMLDVAVFVMLCELVHGSRAGLLRVSASAALLAAVASIVVANVFGFFVMRDWSEARRADVRALAAGDLPSLKDDYPEPHWLPILVRELREIREGPFHD
jgi:hypothetical protein